jgi:hypothetical protein
MDASTPPNQRPPPEVEAARHQEIRGRYRRRKPIRKAGEAYPLAPLRLHQLRVLFRSRYGIALPNDDAGMEDLELLVGYIVLCGKNPWPQIETWAPWCAEADAERMIESAARFPVGHTADDLGRRLGLRYAERQRLNLTTIGSIDVDCVERDRLRRQRCNDEKKRKRALAKRENHCNALLTYRQRKVLAKTGTTTEISVPQLTEQLSRLREFRNLSSPRQEVHRVLGKLAKLGLITDRIEDRPQGGKIRYVRRLQ